ncbi:hypothetical protein HGK75_04155 [uncultured bacterium]|uniref:hypothetical protein n=1 Tax=Acetilactobacillus jinshanensis TaxID=1720083 RepID=UPI0021886A05|nr:hypothetical protein HGK75_04155 [uncultured bacterium]
MKEWKVLIITPDNQANEFNVPRKMYHYAQHHLPLTQVQLMIVHPPHKITPLFNVVGCMHGIQIIGKFNQFQKFVGWFIHMHKRPSNKFKFTLRQAHLHYFAGVNKDNRYLYAKVKRNNYKSLENSLFRLFEVATFIEPKNPTQPQLVKTINKELSKCNQKQLMVVQKFLKDLLARQKKLAKSRFKDRLN